jgi:hypothetical protein
MLEKSLNHKPRSTFLLRKPPNTIESKDGFGFPSDHLAIRGVAD